jgi:hypothetical protein
VLPGSNHNLRHGGVLFHIQTEDCGLENPVVVTQVFVGGNVLATRRGSYAKFVSKPTVKEIVTAMMQEQHKVMMKDLVHGRLPQVQKLLNQPRVPMAPTDAAPKLPPDLPPAAKPPVSPPTQVAQWPARKSGHPAPAQRTLDTSNMKDKTLDELIQEFLDSANQPKS